MKMMRIKGWKYDIVQQLISVFQELNTFYYHIIL